MKRHLAYATVLMLGTISISKAEIGVAKINGTAANSTVTGSASIVETKDGVVVTVKVEGVTPGQHGLHIHEFGSCDDLGKAAGSHFNPLHKDHGHVMKNGIKKAHAGDLGNIEIGNDGKGTLEATIPGVTLSSGKLTIGGRSIILHEKLDDFGQPTGNAGGRIGCGVITIIGSN